MNVQKRMALDNVPYFERAPVVERVLGVQFQPIPGFHTGLLGAFWKSLGDQWPSVSDAHVIESQYVGFDVDRFWGMPSVSLRLVETPPCRLQMLNRQGDRMIQLQNGRFHLNWKGASGVGYPRYPQIRLEFDQHFDLLLKFLRSELNVSPTIELWEVTYLNHLPRSTVWDDPSDWQSLFPPLAQPSAAVMESASNGEAGLSLETFGGTWQYEISPKKGRLHIELRHGRHERADADELLVLALTARGMLQGSTTDEIHQGLDLGRFVIAHAFKSITSEKAHAYWGLKQ